MKAKKILFKCAGVIQFITSGIIAFFGLIMLLIRPLISMVIDNAYTEIKEELKEKTAEELELIDQSMRNIMDMSKEEFSAFFSKWTMVFALFMVTVAIIGIVFGVIFIKCSNRYEYLLKGKKSRKIWLGVLTGIFCNFNISTILVIIALSIRDCKKEKMPLIESDKKSEVDYEGKQKK